MALRIMVTGAIIVVAVRVRMQVSGSWLRAASGSPAPRGELGNPAELLHRLHQLGEIVLTFLVLEARLCRHEWQAAPRNDHQTGT